MSNSIKTFKSNYPGSKKEVQVRSRPGGVHICINGRAYESLSIALTDAPALALAVLDAAGHRPVAYDPERLSGDDLLAYIAHRLAVHVSDEAKRTKEAADREVLESEALGLANEFRASSGYERHKSLAQIDQDVRHRWIAVAKYVRTKTGGTK